MPQEQPQVVRQYQNEHQVVSRREHIAALRQLHSAGREGLIGDAKGWHGALAQAGQSDITLLSMSNAHRSSLRWDAIIQSGQQ